MFAASWSTFAAAARGLRRALVWRALETIESALPRGYWAAAGFGALVGLNLAGSAVFVAAHAGERATVASCFAPLLATGSPEDASLAAAIVAHPQEARAPLRVSPRDDLTAECRERAALIVRALEVEREESRRKLAESVSRLCTTLAQLPPELLPAARERVRAGMTDTWAWTEEAAKLRRCAGIGR